ncbi:hypothetical protein IT568_00140 [bacterium]|nr:hypothetical protein [bacterium]
MFKKTLLILSVSSLGLAFSACDDDDKETTPPEIPQVYADLPGTKIAKDTTWSGNVTLSGKYYVLPGVTLTIEAGATVSFAYHNNVADNVGAIVTLKGDATNFTTERNSAKLVAEGTASQPIVFTSGRTTKSAGDWGGIVLVGEGLNNVSGGIGAVEGLSEAVSYGGTKTNDNSGTLKYVRIEFCGFGLAQDSELNGLSLYSCGSGTTIDHVQVHKCTDDGFEFFGGSVNAKYLVSSHNDDDSFDMDEGWNGKGQFWLGVQKQGADNGFESDGRKTLGEGTPSNPTLYNVTLYGFGAGKDSDDKNYGMRLREDFQGKLYNFVVSNFAGANWKLENTSPDLTEANYTNGSLLLENIVVWDNKKDGAGSHSGFASASDSTKFTAAGKNVHVAEPLFTNPGSFDFRPQTSSPLNSNAKTPTDTFFESVSYRGAFGTTKWTDGWTNFN